MNCRKSSELIELEVNWEQAALLPWKGLDSAATSVPWGALPEQLGLWRHR